MGDLSLDLRASNLINGLLKKVNLIDDINDRLVKVDDFLNKLQDELKKIQVFHKELPLCMLLLNDAIFALKQETTQYRMTSTREPVLEEFIPLKSQPNDEENHITSDENNKGDCDEDSSKDKKNWMSSVQLWNADNVPTTKTIDNTNNHQNVNKTLVLDFQKVEEKRNNAFVDDMYSSMKLKEGSKSLVPMIHTFTGFPEFSRKTNKDDLNLPGLPMLLPTIKNPKQDSNPSVLSSNFGVSKLPNAVSHVSNGQSYIHSVNQQPNSRKQRRCWSPELHRRFVDALTQLGGPQVATPKQIRELMRVDGLTNDEVKSHLQKYRLHTRRVPNTSTNNNTNVLTTSWTTNDQHSESTKPGSSSQSASPQGPLQFSSMDEDDDEKSESYSWKGQVDRP